MILNTIFTILPKRKSDIDAQSQFIYSPKTKIQILIIGVKNTVKFLVLFLAICLLSSPLSAMELKSNEGKDYCRII